MNKRNILRWIARALLLFLSFCGIASLISNKTNPAVNLTQQEVAVALIFGIGGLYGLVYSFQRRKKDGE